MIDKNWETAVKSGVAEIGRLRDENAALKKAFDVQAERIERLEALEMSTIEAQAVAFEKAANDCTQWAMTEKNQDAERAYEAAGATFENRARDLHAALMKALEDGKCRHDWQCGCGRWNGSSLPICAACTREPGARI